MNKVENFFKNAKCKHGQRSAMTNSAWYDLNKDCTVLKLHDMCHNPKRNCQKQITFTPRQILLEGNGFKDTMRSFFNGSQTAWNKFFKPTVNTLAPIIGKAVEARSGNPRLLKLLLIF